MMTLAANVLPIASPQVRPLRVLLLNAGNLYGGIETMLVTLAREQPRTPDVAWSFAIFFEGRFADELRDSGATAHQLGAVRFSRPWTVLAARRRLRNLLVSERWDAVIVNGSWLHVIAAPVVRQRKLPLVFWAHGSEGSDDLLSRLTRRTPPDFIVANSKLTRESVVSHLFPGTASAVLHYPVSISKAIVSNDERNRIRTGFGTPLDAVVGITACRLEAWKGHELLLNALDKVRATASWNWWIVGGPQRPKEQEHLDRLQQRAAQLGLSERIRFVGQRSDVPRLLTAADLHCQPNTGPEPFGIAFVEALCARLPVVTTALGGALEIVDDTCGILTPPGDANELAQVLGQVIDDPALRGRLGAGGPARAAQLCDPVRQIERLRQAISRIAAPKEPVAT
ncbi:MAG TPA: glycosyltransferase family 4 protein [Gemmataceae bacterium]|jgi:glycosyltransferase involved in cell wall biosynthesis|nr:glycosyltransferase family 4 protein [Gemmataceae bacterium]